MANPNIVKDGINGILFNNGDFKELANNILYLLMNSDGSLQMGKAGRNLAQDFFRRKNC